MNKNHTCKAHYAALLPTDRKRRVCLFKQFVVLELPRGYGDVRVPLPVRLLFPTFFEECSGNGANIPGLLLLRT